MRKPIVLSVAAALGLAMLAAAPARAAEKEWTFLVFLNGFNNLDRFGTFNLNQAETVGSSDDVNVVVQWASLATRKVKRLYVTRDTDLDNVTSPVVQDLGTVDMGDYRNLVEFIRWGHQNYPAKHYFVAVWNHGNGWHLQGASRQPSGGLTVNDISYDDISRNHITTEQLGVALAEGARIIGHKIDIYGSDACLMSMAEVSDEVADSVQMFVGSEELEPGDGWPYDGLLARWTANGRASAGDVSKMLTEEYLKYYQRARGEVTLSALDLSGQARLNAAMTTLGTGIRALGADDRRKLIAASEATQSFALDDYGDLADFVARIEAGNLTALRGEPLNEVRAAINGLVTSNVVTDRYAKAKGVAVWLPTTKSAFDMYSTRYSGMKFDQHTRWGDALRSMLY